MRKDQISPALPIPPLDRILALQDRGVIRILALLDSGSLNAGIAFLTKVLAMSPILVLDSRYRGARLGFEVMGRGLISGDCKLDAGKLDARSGR